MCSNSRWRAVVVWCAAAVLQSWSNNAIWADTQSKTSVRLRGPLHEAFAAPLAGANEPGKIVEGRPGRPLEELPAVIKPSSPRAVWIPGYWGWDPYEREFIWVSGVWRMPPPGMRWVPGYWTEHNKGCRWVRGFWYSIKEARLHYMPSPPVERRQESPAPSTAADEFRVPGYWSNKQGEYHWTSDFAAPHKQGWVWIGSHWAWTPRGALFLPGYWDYALANRGVAFAPVRLNADVQTRSGRTAVFAPTVAINLDKLPEAMFVAAGLSHYYFGDYFGGDLRDELRPWYKPDASGDMDPNFAYQRWQRRDQPDWPQALAERYRERRENASSRPAVDFDERSLLPSSTPSLGFSILTLGHSPHANGSLTQMPPEAVRQVAQNSLSVNSLAAQRATFEAAGPATTKTPLVFDLPPPQAPVDRTRLPSQLPSATAGQYVPGVAGREVPGATNRGMPGTSGRTVPGVDVRVPGVTAPGVLPGADTGLERK